MKRLLSPIVIVLSMPLALSKAGAATDLSSTHLYHDEIGYLMDREVITEYRDGTVRPDRVVTRAEVAVIIGRLKWKGDFVKGIVVLLENDE